MVEVYGVRTEVEHLGPIRRSASAHHVGPRQNCRPLLFSLPLSLCRSAFTFFQSIAMRFSRCSNRPLPSFMPTRHHGDSETLTANLFTAAASMLFMCPEP